MKCFTPTLALLLFSSTVCGNCEPTRKKENKRLKKVLGSLSPIMLISSYAPSPEDKRKKYVELFCNRSVKELKEMVKWQYRYDVERPKLIELIEHNAIAETQEEKQKYLKELARIYGNYSEKKMAAFKERFSYDRALLHIQTGMSFEDIDALIIQEPVAEVKKNEEVAT